MLEDVAFNPQTVAAGANFALAVSDEGKVFVQGTGSVTFGIQCKKVCQLLFFHLHDEC